MNSTSAKIAVVYAHQWFRCIDGTALGKKAKVRPEPKYLVDLRFHDLRHEATSRLASIFPMHELTKITGHKDPRMLMRYYYPRAKDLAKRLA